MKRKNIVEKNGVGKKNKSVFTPNKKIEKITHSKKMKLGIIQTVCDIFLTHPIPLKTIRLEIGKIIKCF